MTQSVIKLSHKSASVRLFPDYDSYRVSDLYSKQRGLGHASELMKKVVEYADEHSIDLYLIAQAYGRNPELSNAQLISFYKRFGFKVVPNRKKPTMMERTCIEKEWKKASDNWNDLMGD